MEHVNQATTTHTGAWSRYTGPTAARIAELIAPERRVRFERGWFWTAAVCHDSEQDLAAFRQRPDGDGIDVRCKSAGCSRERIIRSLELLTGESIWSAYTTEPHSSTPTQAAADQSDATDGTGGHSWRLALAPFIVLLLAAPFVFGYDLQVVALNAVGLAWVGWLAHRLLLNRRRSLAKGGRAR
ncbi:MAG: hypothetical protein OXI41_01890 [Chloroflexota bacterium]|nr:hypothetical protein [Chloroflexota bacterium]MDE2895572.1 hypothetical protein [Chloroflexota bacterium]